MSAVGDGMTLVPRIPLGDWANSFVNWLTNHLGGFFTGLADVINNFVQWFDNVLMATPIVLLVVILGVIAALARGWLFGLVAAVGLLLIDSLGAFPSMLQTLSQILVASVIAIVLSVPIGVWCARSKVASSVIRPVLDFMQTLPAYVYLLPFLFLMGLGSACAVLATVIFAMPPGVRLTELGIRQVNEELVEAGQAFGATPSEVLRGIQFPLALPTIMAGINQVIMLALSMVVIGGIVGAPGLGSDVLAALQQLQIGPGVEAGVAVVILAIYLDRVTNGLSRPEIGLIPQIRAFMKPKH